LVFGNVTENKNVSENVPVKNVEFFDSHSLTLN
jgi:hypothetical protein